MSLKSGPTNPPRLRDEANDRRASPNLRLHSHPTNGAWEGRCSFPRGRDVRAKRSPAGERLLHEHDATSPCTLELAAYIESEVHFLGVPMERNRGAKNARVKELKANDADEGMASPRVKLAPRGHISGEKRGIDLVIEHGEAAPLGLPESRFASHGAPASNVELKSSGGSAPRRARRGDLLRGAAVRSSRRLQTAIRAPQARGDPGSARSRDSREDRRIPTTRSLCLMVGILRSAARRASFSSLVGLAWFSILSRRGFSPGTFCPCRTNLRFDVNSELCSAYCFVGRCGAVGSVEKGKPCRFRTRLGGFSPASRCFFCVGERWR